MQGFSELFETYESEVRVYCRKFPVFFVRSKNNSMWDIKGREYIDLMSGAGALNYGHNNDILKKSLIEYLSKDGITHSLDFFTQAKFEFIERFVEDILKPRKLNYKIQFTGPTGSNSVEAAFKLARKVTGRTSIIAFTNGFHGMTLGALAASGTEKKRAAAGIPLDNVIRMPYDNYFGDQKDTIAYIETLLDDPSSGIGLPAAFVVETIQAEGGVNIATKVWLQRLETLAKRKNILLIVDDIQAGCGRTGDFFSFENAGIYPDIVCLSKSISGYGLPMALLLLKPEIDQQQPGEHTGTFRGNNLAFITATSALSFWSNEQFLTNLNEIIQILDNRLNIISDNSNTKCSIKGRGLLRGLAWHNSEVATAISQHAFQNGLIIETSGGNNQVLKVMPPLTMDVPILHAALDTLENSINTISQTLLS